MDVDEIKEFYNEYELWARDQIISGDTRILWQKQYQKYYKKGKATKIGWWNIYICMIDLT